jgi:hypothetical protein
MVTDQQAAALRAMLLGDAGETLRLTARLTDADMPGYQQLAHSLLSVVAGQQFSPGYSNADLVRYVASVRAAHSEDIDEDFDPQAAETVLRHALGQQVPYPGSPDVRLRATMALLAALASDLELKEPGVDGLLAEARSQADAWIASQPT